MKQKFFVSKVGVKNAWIVNFHEKKIPPSIQSNVENEEVNSLFQIVLFTLKNCETFVRES